MGVLTSVSLVVLAFLGIAPLVYGLGLNFFSHGPIEERLFGGLVFGFAGVFALVRTRTIYARLRKDPPSN